MKKDINCPPYAPVLMESTRAIGYSIESAIADIIDNSIAANAKNIDIFFNALGPVGKPYVVILDDGIGMNSDQITKAMRYGTVSPSEERSSTDLGRYGLGMKTASLSQCRALTVVSKVGTGIEGRRWDLEHILETQEWSLEQLDENDLDKVPCVDKLKEKENGTLVVWRSLDKIRKGALTFDKALEEKMADVKKHLELVFHRYLSGDGIGKVIMTMNGLKLVPFDPFFVSKSSVLMDDEKIEIPGRDGKVVIKPYILPHPSKMTKDEIQKYGGKDGLRQLQGFYIYRNKRLITWGTWFKLIKMDEFSKLARVKVDIPNSLDDLWTLDIKKSTAYPPDIVKTRLKQLVSTMSSGSKRTWTFRSRKEIQDGVIHIWDKVETREGIKYFVNQDHPILMELNERLDNETQKMLKSYLETIQNNLPFNSLHIDLNSDEKIANDKKSDEEIRVVFLAKGIIRQAIKDNHLDETMNNFQKVEPFMYYMDEIQKVLAEVKVNG